MKCSVLSCTKSRPIKINEIVKLKLIGFHEHSVTNSTKQRQASDLTICDILSNMISCRIATRLTLERVYLTI